MAISKVKEAATVGIMAISKVKEAATVGTMAISSLILFPNFPDEGRWQA